jgi:hypothetical protein
MPIELGTARTGMPGVRLAAIGDSVVVAVVDVRQVPWTEFGTGEPKIGKDGKPRTQDKVVGLVIKGNGVITDNGTERAVAAGDIVAIYLAGHNRWEFIEAKNKLPRPLNVGDVMQWKYDRDEKSQYASNPKKVKTCVIRPAKPDEADQVRRCEELHHQLRTEGIALDAPKPTSTADDDLEPF